MTKRSITFFDEVNALSSMSISVEDLTSILINGYVVGVKSACEMLGYDVEVDLDDLEEALYVLIDGKTFIDRYEDHMMHEQGSNIHNIEHAHDSDVTSGNNEHTKIPFENVGGTKPVGDSVNPTGSNPATGGNGLKTLIESEAHRMHERGSGKAADDIQTESGRPVSKVWRTMLDERVRSTHDYLEGMKVGINEEFYTYDGDHGMYPHGFGDAGNNVNCRCVLDYEWS